MPIKFFLKHSGFVSSIDENNDSINIAAHNQIVQNGIFLIRRGQVHQLFDGVDGNLVGCYFNSYGVQRPSRGEPLYIFAESCAK